MSNKFFGLIATVALTLAPVAAFAGEIQVNTQSSHNNAVAAGENNTVVQDTTQTSLQDQFGAGGYFRDSDPQTQINKQDSSNNAAAIGYDNTVIQNAEQLSNQVQTDLGH
jgi:hypothetical protein